MILSAIVLAAATTVPTPTWTPFATGQSYYHAYIVLSTTWTEPGHRDTTETRHLVFQTGRAKYNSREECQRDIRNNGLIRQDMTTRLTDLTSSFATAMQPGRLVSASLTLKCAVDKTDKGDL